MNKKTLTISITKRMFDFIQGQVVEQGLRGPDVYVQALLTDAQRRRMESKLHAELMKGVRSGKPIPADDKFWDELHQNVDKKRTRGRAS